MAIYRAGTFLTVLQGVQQNLNLGFVPSVFRCKNLTKSGIQTGVTDVYWDQVLNGLAAGPFTQIGTQAAGVNTWSLIASGTATTALGIVPFESPNNQLYVPNQLPYTDTTRVPMGASTSLVITGISRAANAVVTATHSFTAADIGVTVVTFHGNNGMSQINTLSGVVTAVTGITTFAVSINSTNFNAWAAGGNPLCNVITGAPVSTLYSNQLLPTAQANLGFSGLVIGATVIGAATTGDVWSYEAILQSPCTGP